MTPPSGCPGNFLALLATAGWVPVNPWKTRPLHDTLRDIAQVGSLPLVGTCYTVLLLALNLTWLALLCLIFYAQTNILALGTHYISAVMFVTPYHRAETGYAHMINLYLHFVSPLKYAFPLYSISEKINLLFICIASHILLKAT